MPPAETLYDDRQANEILRTAVRLAARDDITIDELTAAANELGISAEEVREAERRYHKSQTEEGQRKEFRHMQTMELRLTLFHVAVLALILGAVAFVDFRSHFTALAAAIIGAATFYFGYRVWDIHFSNSPKHQKAFEEWVRRKNVWLRPEDSKRIVDEVIRGQLSIYKGFDSTPFLRTHCIDALQRRLGYDKVRASQVLEAFIRENPDVEGRV